MHWIEVIENSISMIIPLASFFAMGYSMFLYSKTKGEKDAKQNTIDTYKGLAEARKDQIEELEYEVSELKRDNQELRAGINMQKEILCTAIDELVAGFVRAGIKVKRPEMRFCEEGEVGENG